MEIKIVKQEKEILVTLEGRLDTLVSPEVSAELEPVIQDATGTIILDCRKMSYISSSGLRIFLTIRKAAAAAGGKVIVRGLLPEVRSVFMMTGFLNLFQIEA